MGCRPVAVVIMHVHTEKIYLFKQITAKAQTARAYVKRTLMKKKRLKLFSHGLIKTSFRTNKDGNVYELVELCVTCPLCLPS